MDTQSLHEIINAVAKGDTSVDEAVNTLTHIACEDIEYAHIDHHRSLRKGFPEVIFGEGKTAAQIVGIMDKMLLQEKVILVINNGFHSSEQCLLSLLDGIDKPLGGIQFLLDETDGFLHFLIPRFALVICIQHISIGAADSEFWRIFRIQE